MSFGLIFVIVVAIVIGAFFARHPDQLERARFLKRSGFTLMGLSTLFFGTFVAGETVTDPGGWKAAGLVAAWAVPLAGAAALAWLRPDRAVGVFAALTLAVVGISVWFAVNPEGWRSFEDRNGPIRGVITFVLAAAIALLGLKRTAPAGVLLLVVGLVPPVVSSLGSLNGFGSLAVVSSAPVVAGVLHLLSARMTVRPAPSARQDATPRDLPKAA
jgi:hypothetical protein